MRIVVLSVAAAVVAWPLSTPARAAIDCEALQNGTAPFQLTSEEILAKDGTSRTLTIISQVYRGPAGVNTERSSLPGRQRESKSRFGIDYDLRMVMASGRALRIVTSGLPDMDLLGQKRDFSLKKKVKSTSSDSDVTIDEHYTFDGVGSFVLGGCKIAVLNYAVESSGVLATRSDFAYAPSLRVKLRSKEITPVDKTEQRAVDVATSFDPLPKLKD